MRIFTYSVGYRDQKTQWHKFVSKKGIHPSIKELEAHAHKKVEKRNSIVSAGARKWPTATGINSILEWRSEAEADRFLKGT